jgi:hypothetical protein
MPWEQRKYDNVVKGIRNKESLTLFLIYSFFKARGVEGAGSTFSKWVAL